MYGRLFTIIITRKMDNNRSILSIRIQLSYKNYRMVIERKWIVQTSQVFKVRFLTAIDDHIFWGKGGINLAKFGFVEKLNSYWIQETS